MKRMISLVCALVLVPVLAAAQPDTPEQWYKEGETQYNLGNFDKAIEAFKQGFALESNESKKAAYLFNVAQSYRQAKNCKEAQFFYKRYLALKDADTVKPITDAKRQEIEGLIRSLDECAKQQEAIRSKPPDHNEKPDGETKPDPAKPDPDRVADPTDPKDPDGTQITETQPGTPRLLSVRLAGGGAKLSTGKLNVPLQATAALIAGYPLAINDKVTVELGGGFTFTPVPFQNMMGKSSSARLYGLMANVGGTYHVAPKVGLRGDLGLGALVFGGVSNSPFTSFAPTTGALTMFHLRAGLSADYAVTPNVIVTVVPFAFSYSPAKAGLRDDIKAITAIDFMVGLGYRM
ncbi:MAG: Tetratricopeptide 2 repeat protein [Deltaproteobacteria bacterium]|nr:Tetratricopeptide 2 repeat protein [Deltaproteobacteria bacterium]